VNQAAHRDASQDTSSAGSTSARRLLVVDDDAAMLRVLALQLARRDFVVDTASDAASCQAALEAQTFDAVLLDYSLAGATGLDLLESIRAADPSLTVVMLSGTIEVPEAVRAIRAGAEDVQLKPPDMDLLQAAIERGLQRTALLRSGRLMAAQVVDPYGVFDESPLMGRVLRQLQHAAARSMPILLVGEPGTGKRALAEIVHQLSAAHHLPMVSIAVHGRDPQVVEQALAAAIQRHGSSGGTIYLDSVATLTPRAQQLLFELLGERARLSGAMPSRLRVVVSTHFDLAEAVRAGALSASLYQRLAVLPIAVPSLRERGAGAIEWLAARTLQRLRLDVGEGPERMSAAAIDWLCSLPWPGNAPQLRAVIEESFTRAIGDEVLDTPHLTPSLAARGLHAGASTERDASDWSLREAERRHIAAVLAMTDGHRTQAAKLLGITRTTLYKKMAEFGLGGTSD
jgi:DNA-binding NtrC family response regulator